MTSTTVPYSETTRGRIEKAMLSPPTEMFNWMKEGVPITVQLVARPHVRIEGVIESFDEYMNLVLQDASEVHVTFGTTVVEKMRKPLGRLMLKGDCVALVFDRIDHRTTVASL